MSKRTLIKNGTIITVDPAIGDLAKSDLLVEEWPHRAGGDEDRCL
jgi:hypothetical protein